MASNVSLGMAVYVEEIKKELHVFLSWSIFKDKNDAIKIKLSTIMSSYDIISLLKLIRINK